MSPTSLRSACPREFVAHAPFDHDRHERPNRRVSPLFIRRPHSFLDASAITRELGREPFCDGVNLRLLVLVHQRTPVQTVRAWSIEATHDSRRATVLHARN